LAEKPKYYWDACAWIGLIKQEPDKYECLKHTIELAQKKEVTIWTSAFTLAEVFKRKCGPSIVGLASSDDQQFEDFLAQDYIIKVQVDSDIGIAARRILRTHSIVGKPQDAIHLATALLNNVDEMHTFDLSNLEFIPLTHVPKRAI
jgi:hypothetical protein